MTPVHCFLKQKLSLMFDGYCLETLSPIYRNTSAFAASLTVTHPLIPSQEGKQATHPSLTNRKQHFKAPLSRGAGVCDACALLPKTKAVTQNLTDNTSPKQQQKHLIPNLAPYRNTPLNPLSRGETSTHPSLTNRKQHLKAPRP